MKKKRTIFISLISIIGLFAILFNIYCLNRFKKHFDFSSSGLRRVFYSGSMWFGGDYNQDKIDQKIDFDKRTDKDFDRDLFSIRWAGVFYAAKSRKYKFFLKSDDGSRLFIDKKLILDNGGIHPVEEVSKKVFLWKGFHYICIEYFQHAGEAEIEFYLKSNKTGHDNGYNAGENFYPTNSVFDIEKIEYEIDRVWDLKKIGNYIFLAGILIIISWYLNIFHYLIRVCEITNVSGFKINRKVCYCILLLILFFDVFLKMKIIYFPFYADERGLMWLLNYGPFGYAPIWAYPLKYFLALMLPLFGVNSIPYGLLVVLASIFTAISFFYFSRLLTSSNITGLLCAFFYIIYGAGLGYTPYIIHQTLINFSYGTLAWSLFFLLKSYERMKYCILSVILGIIGVFCAPPRTLFFPIVYFVLYLGNGFTMFYSMKKKVSLFARGIFICIIFTLINAYLLGINMIDKVFWNKQLQIHNIVDGKTGDNSAENYWINFTDEQQYWIEIDLLKHYLVDRIVVYNTHNGRSFDRGTRKFRIGIGKNRRDIKMVYTGEMPLIQTKKNAIKCKDIKSEVRFIRVYVDSCYGHSSGLNEVKVYVKINSKLKNIAHLKPIRISYNEPFYLIKKTANFLNTALLLNIASNSNLIKYSFLIFVIIAAIFGIFIRKRFMLLISLGGIMLWSYILIMHIFNLGTNYDLQSRNLTPAIIGFSLFWAGVFGLIIEKLLKIPSNKEMRLASIVLISIPLILISKINITNQINIIGEYFFLSAKSKEIRKSIAKHFYELKVPAVMYLQDERSGVFYNCFTGGLWGYAIGLGNDLNYGPDEIQYVTDMDGVIRLMEDGWDDRSGHHVKVSLKDIYGVKLTENGFIDITTEIRDDIRNASNLLI